jgi:hypothetical protein
MENKSSEKLIQETTELHQEESFDSPDGKWTIYVTAVSDGKDIKLDPDWVESDDHEITSDDDFYGEYKQILND